MAIEGLSAWILGLKEDPGAKDMLDLEREAVSAGRMCVAGVDEAGRGPLAGPLVAAAVILEYPVPDVDDSKRLSKAKRERLYKELMEGPHRIAVEVVDSAIIDKEGIQSANYSALARAAEGLSPVPDFLLVDGFSIPGCAIPQARIVKGDQRSQSIAAASVIAKVTRDGIMRDLDSKYPEYGFARHKGYGTRRHIEALRLHGPCRVHRRSFAPIASCRETIVLFPEGDSQ